MNSMCILVTGATGHVGTDPHRAGDDTARSRRMVRTFTPPTALRTELDRVIDLIPTHLMRMARPI